MELSAHADADNPNHLPIPDKDAYLILRLDGPSQSVLDGGYSMPVFEIRQLGHRRPTRLRLATPTTATQPSENDANVPAQRVCYRRARDA